MGEIVKRKKKGRPSKADLAKRSYKAAKNELQGNEPRRSLRPRGVRYTFDLDDYLDDDELFEDFEDEEDERRREKKIKLLLKLHQSCTSKENFQTVDKVTSESTPSRTRRLSQVSSASQSSDECRGEENKPTKKRKTCGDDDAEEYEDQIDEIDDEDNENVGNVEEFLNAGKVDNKKMDFESGTLMDLSSSLPIPEKKVLELMLDKLQKKDIYGVYADPVDPEELPDYHDIIEHPMDFATVRSKLANGSYATLEQFESDVFLICSNAMQYNSPDTIYYKQARAIQELAKSKFEKIRIGIERSEEPLKLDQKSRISSIIKRPIRKPSSRELPDPLGSDFSSTLATVEDFHNSPIAAHASGSDRANSLDRLIEGHHAIIDNSVDKAEESVPGKRLPSRIERKPSFNDEMRRATYDMCNQTTSSCPETIFSAFEGESKHLIPVGLYVDHSYARSLARFASTLGHVAWGIASSRIEQALPSGCKFGRGWVGDYEPLPTPVLLVETCTIKEPALFKEVDHTKEVTKTSSNQDSVEEKPVSVTTAHLEKSDRRLLASKDNQNIESNLLEKKSSFAVSPPGFPVLSDTQTHHLRFPPGFDERKSPGNGMKPTFSAATCFQQTNQQSRNLMESEKKGVKQVGLSGPMLISQCVSASSTMQKQNLNNLESTALMPVVKLPPTNNNHLPPGFFKQTGLTGEKMKILNNAYGAKPVAYISHGHDQQGLLTDPVQLMRSLSEKAQNQQRLLSVQSSVDNKPIMRADDSANISPRAWMSAGGGGFKMSGENTANHKNHTSSSDSAIYNYNTGRDFQPQASRFRGEHHPSYLSPPFISQPGKIISDVQFQNQPVIRVPQLATADLSRFQWTSGSPQMVQQQQQPRQKVDPFPPDLNISFPSSGSPGGPASNVLVDSQQPDLALQL